MCKLGERCSLTKKTGNKPGERECIMKTLTDLESYLREVLKGFINDETDTDWQAGYLDAMIEVAKVMGIEGLPLEEAERLFKVPAIVGEKQPDGTFKRVEKMIRPLYVGEDALQTITDLVLMLNTCSKQELEEVSSELIAAWNSLGDAVYAVRPKLFDMRLEGFTQARKKAA
jgi:hypothetical protein